MVPSEDSQDFPGLNEQLDDLDQGERDQLLARILVRLDNQARAQTQLRDSHYSFLQNLEFRQTQMEKSRDSFNQLIETLENRAVALENRELARQELREETLSFDPEGLVRDMQGLQSQIQGLVIRLDAEGQRHTIHSEAIADLEKKIEGLSNSTEGALGVGDGAIEGLRGRLDKVEADFLNQGNWVKNFLERFQNVDASIHSFSSWLSAIDAWRGKWGPTLEGLDKVVAGDAIIVGNLVQRRLDTLEGHVKQFGTLQATYEQMIEGQGKEVAAVRLKMEGLQDKIETFGHDFIVWGQRTRDQGEAWKSLDQAIQDVSKVALDAGARAQTLEHDFPALTQRLGDLEATLTASLRLVSEGLNEVRSYIENQTAPEPFNQEELLARVHKMVMVQLDESLSIAYRKLEGAMARRREEDALLVAGMRAEAV